MNGHTFAPATHDVRSTTGPPSLGRSWLAVVVASAALNLLIRAGAQLAGAEFVISPPGAEPTSVAPAVVALMTVAPLVVGGIAVALATRGASRVPPAWSWLCLAIGIVTMPMPFTMQAGHSTQYALVVMQPVTGIVWWVALHRSSR